MIPGLAWSDHMYLLYMDIFSLITTPWLFCSSFSYCTVASISTSSAVQWTSHRPFPPNRLRSTGHGYLSPEWLIDNRQVTLHRRGYFPPRRLLSTKFGKNFCGAEGVSIFLFQGFRGFRGSRVFVCYYRKQGLKTKIWKPRKCWKARTRKYSFLS